MTATISLENVSKHYRKYDDRARLSGRFGRLLTRTSRSWLPALRDVDLQVQPGESVGVVGRNGAGKSTLLQLLCGVTAPSAGRVSVRGRVAPLISVGVGFHPELTGRENVYVNGTILGMTKAEIDRRFDDVVAFAELEHFIDTPVKFYSSGMFVRLGFAVAVEARPDVLLVDEVLAVGDFAFQVRCFERMNEIRAAGTTIVVVSHNMSSIRGFCDRGIVLNAGRVEHDGSPVDAIARYYELSAGAEPLPSEAHDIEVEEYRVLGSDGAPATSVRAGEELVLRAAVRSPRPVDAPFLWLAVESGSGVVVYSEARLKEPMAPMGPGARAVFEVRLPAALPTGSYIVRAALRQADGGGRTSLLAQFPPTSVYVSGRPHVHGAADLGASFARLDGQE